jgi:hypothetical protein
LRTFDHLQELVLYGLGLYLDIENMEQQQEIEKKEREKLKLFEQKILEMAKAEGAFKLMKRVLPEINFYTVSYSAGDHYFCGKNWVGNWELTGMGISGATRNRQSGSK